MVVAVFAGTHLSYRPPLNARCPPFQSWLRSCRNCMPMSSAAGWNGSTSRTPSDWCHTSLPLGSVTGRGSPNPRTPRSEPK